MPTETVPGLRDNVLVVEALARIAGTAARPQDLLERRAPAAAGSPVPAGEGRRAHAARRGQGAAARAGRRWGTRSFVARLQQRRAPAGERPRRRRRRHLGDGPAGALGPPRTCSPGRTTACILDHVVGARSRDPPARRCSRRWSTSAIQTLTIKTLLADERTAATASAVADALTRVPFWVAVGRAARPAARDRRGAHRGRARGSSRCTRTRSRWPRCGRGDQPAPMTGAQLGVALRRDEGLTGVDRRSGRAVDPAHPRGPRSAARARRLISPLTVARFDRRRTL